jgi:hypothetical protein
MRPILILRSYRDPPKTVPFQTGSADEQRQRNFARLQVLLIADIFVGRHHDFETGLLGNVDQLAV